MSRRILLFLLLTGIPALAFSQRSLPDSLALSFRNQLEVFPQEKIYVHTDKPYYLSGEKIWFRAYLVDAVTHIPSPVSRYVYVELINPLDSVVTRVKIREVEEAYHGYLLIPDDVPEGDYTLRAYTTFMRSQVEDYFFAKTLHIGDPQARTVQTDTRFFFESDRRVHATFRFSNIVTSDPFIPKSVKVSVNEGLPMSLKVEPDGTTTINFNLPATSRQRTLLLEVTTDRYVYRQFVPVPTPDNDFDVSFYHEGGSLIEGAIGKVAFKAMKSNGQAIEVVGTVYNQSGDEVCTFESSYLGMGSFMLLPQQGQSYYAVCENNKGQSKRFDLSAALDYGFTISTSSLKGNINISIVKPQGTGPNEKLYLMAHTRGMIHLMDIWDFEKNLEVIAKEWLPSGVLHLILFDAQLNPLSERLVFVNNYDQAQVSYEADKKSYDRRSLVKNSITLTDNKGHSLAGSFSVSVTSDREVIPDSTANILTQLLLTSDLKGYIENPAFYFKNTRESEIALDLLMLTQGWRRYNVADWAQGRFAQPEFPVEFAPEVSGSVKSASTGKGVEDIEVLVASIAGNYYNTVKTGSDGRFFASLGDFLDSTRYAVSVDPGKGKTRMELLVDHETFPERTLSVTPSADVDKSQFALYANKAEQQYIYEGGIRITQLSAAMVIAERKSKTVYKSDFYESPPRVNTLTEEKMEELRGLKFKDAVSRIPGVKISYESGGVFIYLRPGMTLSGSPPLPLILINEMPMPYEIIHMIDMNDIARIDVLMPGPQSAKFGATGYGGVISIFTKRGRSMNNMNNIITSLNIRAFIPLGYQHPVEFYAPKYETEAKRNNGKPDLRTTIHWQPVVQTDNLGVASFEFYTADEQTSYTVTIEGVDDDGRIIQKNEKIYITPKK